MIITQSLHNHTVFDDGRDTPEAMARAALAAGLRGFGISAHSPMDGEPWTVAPEKMETFRAEMARLKRDFAPALPVWCGLEFDMTSDRRWLAGFDYVIASVHALQTPSGLWALDDNRERSRRMIVLAFDGDADAAAEAYFAAVAGIADLPEADIVGHFDLITKFDEPEPLYNARSPRYQAAALAAMERLVQAGKIFEINTGAVSRGYRTSFYPDGALLRALRAMGGRITVSADAHSAANVTFAFDAAEQAARDAGFTELWEFDGSGFAPRAL